MAWIMQEYTTAAPNRWNRKGDQEQTWNGRSPYSGNFYTYRRHNGWNWTWGGNWTWNGRQAGGQKGKYGNQKAKKQIDKEVYQ